MARPNSHLTIVGTISRPEPLHGESEEPFIKNIDWLDNLKLRVSFGQVGNDGINSNLWSQSWGSVTDRRFEYAINEQRQSAYDLASSTLANPNLKWETTITRSSEPIFHFLTIV